MENRPADTYLNWEETPNFFTYLKASGLSPRSLQEYMNYHSKFYEFFGEADPNQNMINQFVERYNNQPSRSFVRHLLNFRKIDNLSIPKRLGAKAKRQKNYIPPEDIVKIVEILERKDLKWGLMLLLTYECALRKKEVQSIRVCDFEWSSWYENKEENGILLINHRGAKRMKERFVVVPAPLMEAIHAYGKREKRSKEEKLFKIKTKSSGWHNHFKEAVRQIKKDYTLHELRFTKATEWHRNGIDIMRIKDRLGHSSLSTTQMYIDPSSRNEAERWRKGL